MLNNIIFNMSLFARIGRHAWLSADNGIQAFHRIRELLGNVVQSAALRPRKAAQALQCLTAAFMTLTDLSTPWVYRFSRLALDSQQRSCPAGHLSRR